MIDQSPNHLLGLLQLLTDCVVGDERVRVMNAIAALPLIHTTEGTAVLLTDVLDIVQGRTNG